jgi:hypothetical protein
MRTSHKYLLAGVIAFAVLACATRQGPGTGELHRWWAGLGPVLPHDTFPADCKLCHVGQEWHTLSPNFTFDHEKETGVPLRGAHAEAKCLRCHNDRGPVSVFQSQGCAGCHEDVHQGKLDPNCSSCHDESVWQPTAMIERHDRTRFPLEGAHVGTACHRCHPGAWVGNFSPTDPECVTCHMSELAGTNNPPHIPLGLVDKCDRCHFPTNWRHARQD